jgi:uncharacterized protein (TIGR03435 family)
MRGFRTVQLTPRRVSCLFGDEGPEPDRAGHIASKHGPAPNCVRQGRALRREPAIQKAGGDAIEESSMDRLLLICVAVTLIIGCNKSAPPATGGAPVVPAETPAVADRTPTPAAIDAAVRVGQPAPPIRLKKLLQAPTDAPATLDGLKGKAVVLEFWFTSCGPCVAAFPHLNELVAQTKGDPVVFVAVTEETEGPVAKLLAAKPLATWVGLDDRGATTRGYGVQAFPTTVLIDPAGVVRAITHPTAVTAGMVKDLAHGRPLKADPKGVEELPKLDKDLLGKSVPAGPGGLDLNTAAFLVYLGPPSDHLGDPVQSPTMTRSRQATVRQILGGCYGVSGPRLVIDLPAADADKEFGFIVRVPDGSPVSPNDLLRQAVEAATGVRGVREKREMDVWVLKKLGPNGGPPKFAGDPTLGGRLTGRETTTRGDNMPAAYLVHGLERISMQTVVDETGLADTYEWDLAFTSPQLADMNAGLKTIGLSLSAERRAVEVVVVRRSEPPKRNN